jgi:YVTN family beta-propeller protein
VSVIATATNGVVATIGVGGAPSGVAVTPDSSKVYVTNGNCCAVSVIDTASNAVVATIEVGLQPEGVAVTPDGSRAYVTDYSTNTVSVIDTATDTVVGSPIEVGVRPEGVAVTPDGSKAYVANQGSGFVSVIATASNAVVATIRVGVFPSAFGLFIGPPKAEFAGTPGQANCHDKSVSALARHYGGMSAAARALDYASVDALQEAIATYCNG